MRTHRKYTQEFKQEAVNLALKTSSLCRTAKELGIPEATLYSWINELKKKVVPTGEANKTGSENADIAALLEENRRLHKELAIAKEEKEILKKAAAYFAQHQK